MLIVQVQYKGLDKLVLVHPHEGGVLLRLIK